MDTPYIELFAGSQQVATTLVHFAADAGVIQEFTPLMLADNGEFKPWDGQESGKAVYLTTRRGYSILPPLTGLRASTPMRKNAPPLRVPAYPFSRWPDKQGERWQRMKAS